MPGDCWDTSSEMVAGSNGTAPDSTFSAICIAVSTILETIKYRVNVEHVTNMVPWINCLRYICPRPGNINVDNRIAFVDFFIGCSASRNYFLKVVDYYLAGVAAPNVISDIWCIFTIEICPLPSGRCHLYTATSLGG
jgi:hypothetical protein